MVFWSVHVEGDKVLFYIFCFFFFPSSWVTSFKCLKYALSTQVKSIIKVCRYVSFEFVPQNDNLIHRVILVFSYTLAAVDLRGFLGKLIRTTEG